MKRNTGKELFYVLLTIIPYIYLVLIYAGLPETVPTHFDIHGTPNGWSSRSSLWFIPASLSLLTYLLFTFLPLIDPKQKLKANSGKFEHIRFILVLFMTGIACFALYVSANRNVQHMDKFLFAFLGLFFAALGNFMPSLKPNYFIGIRTPWSLENEQVWKKTHQFAGKLWVAGGLLVMLLAFLVSAASYIADAILPVILLIAFIPAVYSYVLWRKLKKNVS